MESFGIINAGELWGQAMTRAYAVGDFVSSETRFDGTRVDCAYDAAGNRLSKTDAGGTVTYTLGARQSGYGTIRGNERN